MAGTFWLDTNEEELEDDIPFDQLEEMFSAKPAKVCALQAKRNEQPHFRGITAVERDLT